jgi:LruC domain-containing protein
LKKYYLLLPLIFAFSCIEKPDFLGEVASEKITAIVFPENFDYSTSHTVTLSIADGNTKSAIYEIGYELNGENFSLGAYVKQIMGLSTSLILPTAVDKITLVKKDGLSANVHEGKVVGNRITIDLNQKGSGGIGSQNSSRISEGCVDHLYAVNGDADFFTIDVTTADLNLTILPNLVGGGSIACALDQENSILYYNVGKVMYAYDIQANTFSQAFNSNPFNGNYPRLEFYKGFFYMSNGNTMYKVNATTNQTVATYTISGFINSNGGGDLAFDSKGELYLACFSGLYKFSEINDQAGTAQLVRISAENFPFQLTSMAIDRQDRLFVGTTDANSKLIQISKEDGSYSIVKTFNTKINDLTAWKCETNELGQVDSDNDGVIDELDDYPNDPEAAVDVFTPSALGMGSYAFEDFWPIKGDYDFNDMVVSYRYTNVLNSSNKSVRLKMNFVLKAVGAGFHSGFGVELDVDSRYIQSVTGHSTLGNNTALSSKGLEQAQSKSVIIVFNDSFNHMRPAGGAKYMNTDPNEPRVPNQKFEVIIEFTEPIDPAGIGEAPFNPFIFSSTQRGKEIHLAGKQPTSLANQTLFGTAEDDTNLGTGKTYLDKNNLPWAIHIIHNFRYPTEKSKINQGYNKFVDWAKTGGTQYKDWYGDNSGYRNTDKLFFND